MLHCFREDAFELGNRSSDKGHFTNIFVCFQSPTFLEADFLQITEVLMIGVIFYNEITSFGIFQSKSTLIFDNPHIMQTDDSPFFGERGQLLQVQAESYRFLVLGIA